MSQAEKRAHHNALERKRRDHIKDSFTSLRETVPALQGEKAVSLTNNWTFWVGCVFSEDLLSARVLFSFM
jgi:hypothetical protein